jgi:hypothetical protein
MTTDPQTSSPPVPPGTLTAPASGPEVLAFLEVLGRWREQLGDSLDELDAAAQLATHPDAYTSDITLAMSMRQSIDARYHELVVAYDSGRVGADERAQLAQLMWGRLPDALGAPTAFTLTEACTLTAALVDRLHAALSSDAVGGSGVANRILTVRAAVERCRRQVEVLGIDPTAVDVQSDRLERAVAGGARDELRATVDEVDVAVAHLERDLIKEASRRATTAHRLAEHAQRYAELVAATASVSALAARCRDRISDPPTLAVPDASVLGPPPAAPAPDSSDAAAWAATSAQLDEYATRLDRCGRALDEAERAYAAPLAERDDLRGLLGAYRTRAARSGLAEDPRLTVAYEAARDLLWSAPCDVPLARTRVEAYQHAVRAAVGVETGPEGEPS